MSYRTYLCWINLLNYGLCTWSHRLRRWTNMAKTKGEETKNWAVAVTGDGPFIVWFYQAMLANSLILALRRDHLQSILEAFGKLCSKGRMTESHPRCSHCTRWYRKGAEAVPKLGKLKCLKNGDSYTCALTWGAWQVHKIIIILQPPPTWQPSYLLGKDGTHRHCLKKEKLCQKAAFSFTFLVFHSLF